MSILATSNKNVLSTINQVHLMLFYKANKKKIVQLTGFKFLISCNNGWIRIFFFKSRQVEA